VGSSHDPVGESATQEIVTGMLWGGRFQAPPHPDLLRMTASIGIDTRLLEHDVAATKAHARVLARADLLEPADLGVIDAACDALVAEWHTGALVPTATDEDVHSLVERELTERLGDMGARIHSGRSRHDLVATDLRLWCRTQARAAIERVIGLLETIADVAEEHVDTLMPGYTHLQRAQPVSLGFHLLAHGFALARDGARFAAAHEAADSCPLGAGALAGTTLPLDASVAASELGFAKTFDNAMDAVADRDFACDLLYAAALCGVHLSRLAEEMVLWTSAEFGFARLADEWSTGSSMMPQKRNPDLAELVRGWSAGSIADLTGLLSLLKGLPLAYNRDLQEDKRFVFAGAERIVTALEAADALLRALEFDRDRLAQAASAGATWATDLAEALVARGVPFREAHRATGELVKQLDAAGSASPAPDDLGARAPFRAEDAALLDARAGLAARSSPGGPAPARVAEQIERLRSRSAHFRLVLDQ
jgi:argininosuccinate lyase